MELRPFQTADARPILKLRLANRRYLERTERVDHLLWEKLEDD